MTHSRSSSLSNEDPLSRFFGSSSNSPSTSANTSREDLSSPSASGIVPSQIPTTLHQVKELSFRGLDMPCKLAVNAAPGCGGIVWPAGEILSEYLLHLIDLQPDRYADKTVLELGAGTGLVSLVLGLKESRARIYSTDQLQLIPLMQENVDLNGLSPAVSADVLNWGEDSIPEEIPSNPDVVLMADCVYFEPAFPLLVKTLLLLTSDSEKQPTMFIAYKKRRKADKRFFQLLHKSFWTEEVADPRKAEYEREGLKLMQVYRGKAPKSTKPPRAAASSPSSSSKSLNG